MTFCSRDLDLEVMTSTYKLVLDIPKVYRHTKNKVPRSIRLSKVSLQLERDRRTQSYTQTDTSERIPHLRVVKILCGL